MGYFIWKSGRWRQQLQNQAILLENTSYHFVLSYLIADLEIVLRLLSKITNFFVIQWSLTLVQVEFMGLITVSVVSYHFVQSVDDANPVS
jgi:hypothetical protein